MLGLKLWEMIYVRFSLCLQTCVTGVLKILNSGGIKLSTCQSLASKLRGCVDAEPGNHLINYFYELLNKNVS